MKILNKYGMGMALVAASSFMLTGCIDETFPTQNATTGQVEENSQAVEAMLMAVPAQLNTETLGRGAHWDFGYPAIMHVRDVMTQDMATANDNMYNQFSSWGQNVAQGIDYAYAQMLWTAQTSYVNGANVIIRTLDPETASDTQLGYLGAALAYRALGKDLLVFNVAALRNVINERYVMSTGTKIAIQAVCLKNPTVVPSSRVCDNF